METSHRSSIRSILVDDDRDFRLLVRIVMEKVGASRYEVVGEAESGAECLDLVERLRPDLVVLDLTMPRTDPYEVIRDVVTQHPDTNVVVLSGFEAGDVKPRVLASGARGYVEKGFDITQIRDQLDTLLTA